MEKIMNNQLIIKKLILSGLNYRRILPFREGINIISGEKTSGKTLVLELIDFCLGKRNKIPLNVQKELASCVDNIFLEIEINQEMLTIKRSLKLSANKFYLYYSKFNNLTDYVPKVLNRKEYLETLLLQLNIPKIEIAKNKKNSTEKTLETISFRDIIRFVNISQHDFGTDNFLGYNEFIKKNKIKPVFEIITKLLEPSKNFLQIKKMNLENEIHKYNHLIKGFTQYLEGKNSLDLLEIENKLCTIEQNIKESKLKKHELYDDLSNNKSTNQDIYIKIKEKVLKTDQEITNFNTEIKNLELSLLRKDEMSKEYEKNYNELKATEESMYKVTKDKHSIICPLCESHVFLKENDSSKDVTIILESAKKIKTRKILVEELIISERKKISQIKKKVKALQEYKEILFNALKEYEEGIKVPYFSEIESLNRLINDFNIQYNSVVEAKQMHNKIDEFHNEIDKIKIKLDEVNNKIKEKNNLKKYKEDIFLKLNKEYRYYLNRFKQNYKKEETYINSDNYLPYIDNVSMFEYTSGGLLQCTQIAYLSSIIKLKETTEINHPGILMLDTLGKYLGTNSAEGESIKDPEVYDEIYKVLIEISDKSQIFIVDNTPPEIAKDYINYTFYADGRGLIDLNQNDLKK